MGLEKKKNPEEGDVKYMIRNFLPSDINYVVDSHTKVYVNEYNFDESFKDYIVETTQRFIKTFDTERENLWIVEKDEQPTGSIAIVKLDNATAQLRWFLLEQQARGQGLGNELVKKAISFSKEKGYRTICLWTSNLLIAARHLYRQHGFVLSERIEQIRSGIPLIEERWELHLRD